MRFFVAFVFSGTLLCGAAEGPAARWEGVVQIPGRDLRLIIDLAQDAQGQWTGSAIAPGAGVKGAPLAQIAVHDSEVAFTIPGALGGPKLKGRIENGGAFRGEYEQAGNTAPFLLERAGAPQVDPPRRSTPVRQELVGEWQGDLTLNGNKLRAIITLANTPAGATAQFVVVGKRRTEIPVDLVTEEEGLLTLESHAFRVSFEGRIRQGTPEIVGAFLQGPIEAPMILHPAETKGTRP